MICKEKVNDGNNTYETEERVPINQTTSSDTYTTNGMKDIDDAFSQFDKSFGGFPFFGPVFTPFFK